MYPFAEIIRGIQVGRSHERDMKERDRKRNFCTVNHL